MLIRPLRLEAEDSLAAALGLSHAEIQRLADTAGSFYEPFWVERGGKTRLIDCPIDPLKTIQKRIDRRFLRQLPYPPHLHGGIRKRSPNTNAIVHLGQPCVVRIDVQDYFPSIRHRQVYEVWNDLLGCSPNVSRLLTKLTTWRGRIPQGASSSVSLANLVLLPVDEEILSLVRVNKLRYTRYVDDLVFSGAAARRIIQPVISVLHNTGFQVSRKKVEVMSRGKRQVVTGHTVNRGDRLTKGGKYRDRIRAAIHQLPELFDHPHLLKVSVDSIRGRLEHLSTVNPESASTLQEKLEAALADQPSVAKLPGKHRKKFRKGVSVTEWRRSRTE